MNERVVLVTRASRGIGKAIAEKFAQHGDRVFGTARQPESIKWAPGTLLPLDVQEETSVAQCVETILTQAKVIEKIRLGVENGDDPVKVAKAVLQAATKKGPNVKVLVGRGARQVRVLRTLLPRALFELGLRRQFGLSGPTNPVPSGNEGPKPEETTIDA